MVVEEDEEEEEEEEGGKMEAGVVGAWLMGVTSIGSHRRFENDHGELQ
jgi:hypothetical protein